MSLEERFAVASKEATNLAAQPTNDEKLKLYQYFKQVKDGDCTGERPGMFSFEAKAKYDAWFALKGMSKEQGMEEYIKVAEELKGKYGLKE